MDLEKCGGGSRETHDAGKVVILIEVRDDSDLNFVVTVVTVVTW